MPNNNSVVKPCDPRMVDLAFHLILRHLDFPNGQGNLGNKILQCQHKPLQTLLLQRMRQGFIPLVKFKPTDFVSIPEALVVRERKQVSLSFWRVPCLSCGCSPE